MTVTYTGEVATCTGFGCFWKLLFRWKGSIYKLLWPNLVVYSVLYFGLSATYRFMLDSEQRNLFEKMSLHCQVYGDLIPVSFVLGFYVSVVIKRWWDQYLCLPWPDNLALFVSSLVHGQDDRGRIMRRTIMRYVNLSLLLTLRMISPRVKKRFPTLDHVVEAGWMLSGEKKIFEDLEQKTFHVKYWMPLVWAGGIVTRARKEGRIKDDFALKTIIDELNTFRGGCGGMLNYDWISIPLVYTQVVTLAVYVFFLSTLMGSQFLDPSKNYPKHQIDLIFPAFTFLQFFFYMGWLKVAESLVNPFGEDDDDFELNWLLDRNLQISYVIVDEMHQEHPEMLKDQYWDEVFPMELPYTAAAKQYQTGPPQYSAEEVEVPSHKAEFMPLDCVFEENAKDNMEADYVSVQRGETHPMKIRKPRSSCVTDMVSDSSPYSRKNSILSLLTRRFSQNDNTKEEINKLRSSVLLNCKNNRNTSRVSVSQTIAPSMCSFEKDSIPYIDCQDEVFSMSDLDVPASIPSPMKEESPPTHLFYNNLFERKGSIRKVMVQNNSPVYHIFAPLSSAASKSGSKEIQRRISSQVEKNGRDSGNHSDRNETSSLCSENLINVLPHSDVPRLPITGVQIECFEQPVETTFFTNPESQFEAGFTSSQNEGFSYDKQYPAVKESLHSSLYLCNATSPNFTGRDIPNLLGQSWENHCEKISGDVRNIFLHASKTEVTSEPSTLNDRPSNSKLAKYELKVSDSKVESVANPVPVPSQAHAAPAGDLEIYNFRRSNIEHCTEGSISPEPSIKRILND